MPCLVQFEMRRCVACLLASMPTAYASGIWCLEPPSGPHIPASFASLQKEAVLGMLRNKMQEEGLRTYMLAYGRFYSSLSIAQLCDMFELPERKASLV